MRRWIRRLLLWLVGAVEERKLSGPLHLIDGSRWWPESRRGLAIVGRSESGERRVITSGQCPDLQAFRAHWAALGGSWRGVTWEDGTPAENDPPAG